MTETSPLLTMSFLDDSLERCIETVGTVLDHLEVSFDTITASVRSRCFCITKPKYPETFIYYVKFLNWSAPCINNIYWITVIRMLEKNSS